MSGQKGPQYEQAGVAIANRNPFNTNIPNKRQTVNDGQALLGAFVSGNFTFQGVIPFLQTSQFDLIETFLFTEDVPTRQTLHFFRQSDYSKVAVGSPAVDYPFNVPILCVDSPLSLNALPSLVDGYTAITAANGIAYGQITTGTTETNAVKVRGFASTVPAPIVYETETRYGGINLATPVTRWDLVTIDFSTRSQCVNGYAIYNGQTLDTPSVVVPVLLDETDYTQAMQDAGNKFIIGAVTVLIVGLYKYISD
jgi:hypothetical protein